MATSDSLRKALRLSIILGLLTLPLTASTWAGTLGTTSVAPTSVSVGTATTVLVTSLITDTSVIPSSVVLQTLDSSGRVIAVVGNLHDDGLNGDATAGDNIYSIQTTVYQTSPGSVTFRVSAGFKGSLLRSFSAPMVVSVTGTAIGINIVSPANLLYTNISPVTVTGTVGDPNAQVTLNGINAPVGSGMFAVTVPLVEGLNTLTAVANNSNGLATSASVQVTLDTTPPHITIDSPANGATTTAAAVTVTGTANDVVVGTVNSADVQVTVNGLAAQVANRTYSAANVPLSVGQNTIQARGVDRAGNAVTTNITVTRVLPSQPPAPAIGSALITQSLATVSGNNQTATIGSQLAAPLVVALTDSSNVPLPNQTVVFKVTGNNGLLSAGGASTPSAAVAVTTGANGQAQVLWTLGQRSGAGINIVHASAALAVGSADFTATGLVATPAMIVVDSGNCQTGALGQALPFPLVADVVDAGHNRVPNVSVTFTVKRGGGNFAGGPSQTVTTDSNGRAIGVLTLGTQPGNSNNVVEANFAGNTGFPAAFSASALPPGNPTNTTISGVVFDNSNNPIPGVTMRLFQTNQGNNNNLPVQIGNPVQTNARGMFLIQPAPVGFFKLMADGSTAANLGSYPTLEYDITTIAGNDNTVGMPIYLPALDTTNRLCVDATHGGTLTLPQVPGFSLSVLPGSATFPGGSKQGCVSVTPVNGDKVPMAPGFGQQPRFIVTIQPVGTTFNPPAAITLPNVDGLKPKAVTEMYSYDHDLGMFIAIGTGTVSDDGSAIVSNPGVGVLKAGWHCGGNPAANGTVADCPDCQICQNNTCVADPNKDGTVCQGNKVCCNGTCIQPRVDVFINNTQTNSDDITVLNPAQTIPTLLTMHTQPGCKAVHVTISAMPAGRVSLGQTGFDLTDGGTATVTITPLAVSAAANDVMIIATVNGAQVGSGMMTVVNVTFPGIRNSDTPTGVVDRIPPTTNTPIQVTVQPDLTGSGQKVTLAKLNNSATNGDFTIGGAATQDIVNTTTVNLSGTTQTAPTGGTGGGNAGNLKVAAQVRGQNAVQSSGFTVAAIPVNFSTAFSGNINDGTLVGLQVTNSWTSDSGSLADLDAVQRSEQIEVVTATGVFSGTGGQTSGFFPATIGSLTDMHGTPAAILTGNGLRVANQTFIFNDLRTGATNASCPNSGFIITRTATLNGDGSVTFVTSKVGAATTANGHASAAGAGSAQNTFRLIGGVVQP